LQYQLLDKDDQCQARLGRLRLPHGELETPAFMAVGTVASVKGLLMDQVAQTGTPVVLGNTYHLHLRPGEEIIREAGGLHRFTGWKGPMLTDSGGFQVFSLSTLNKVDDEGVTFRSHIDGHRLHMNAESSIGIQNAIGADIIMAFDQCPALPGTKEQIKQAVDRSILWARRSLDAHIRPHDQALFGIVQGGLDPQMREYCADALKELDLPGYAMGGLSVGESPEEMNSTLEKTVHFLPEHKPRYLMGVGPPRDIVRAVSHGIDMFDCVLPTRNARNASIFTWSDGVVKIRNARFKTDFGALDPDCPCFPCSQGLTRAYLSHLCRAKEMAFCTLATIHNLTFYQQLMAKIRLAIKQNRMLELVAEIERRFP
jgi:queuine tRNA-ribosyltransferase